MVESNREHGEGRSDVVVYDLHGGRMAIFEAKYSKTFEKLSDDCNHRGICGRSDCETVRI